MVNEQNSCCCCGEFLLFPVGPSPHPLDQKRRAWKALKGNQDVARLNRLNQSLFLKKRKKNYGTYHKEPWRESIQLWWRESVMIHHSPPTTAQPRKRLQRCSRDHKCRRLDTDAAAAAIHHKNVTTWYSSSSNSLDNQTHLGLYADTAFYSTQEYWEISSKHSKKMKYFEY